MPQEGASVSLTPGRLLAGIVGVWFVASNIIVDLPVPSAKLQGRTLSASPNLRQETPPLEQPSAAASNSESSKVKRYHHSSVKIHAWRRRYERQCQDETSTKEALLETLSSLLKVPAKQQLTASTSQAGFTMERLSRCNFTVLDFGANVGDSLGKFIDSKIDPCPSKGLPKNPRLDLDKVTFGSTFHTTENPLVRSSRRILEEVNHVPEDYCYVGVEGNPRFTERLQALEARMANVHPQPIRSAHFLTETVGAGVDGPTTLYLDTINSDKNFWGSSILETHQDVQKSVEVAASAHRVGDKPTLMAAPVQGITLTTLLQKTVNKQPGSHVLVKMDIEGGEYTVLEEAYQSGSLCDFARSGVTIHLVLETHRPDVIGMTNFDLEHWRQVKKSFQTCGVVLYKGRDAG